MLRTRCWLGFRPPSITNYPNGDFPIWVSIFNRHIAVSFDNPRYMPFFFSLWEIFLCIQKIHFFSRGRYFIVRKIFYSAEDSFQFRRYEN